MADLEIKITTKAELAGAQSAARSLEAQIGKAKALGKEYGDLQAKLDHANRAIANFKPPPEPPKSLFTHIQDFAVSNLGRVVSGFLTISGAISAVKTALMEFAKSEQAFAKLDVALALSGKLTQDYHDKLAALAEQMALATNTADEEWLGALQRLTQFGAKPEQINKLAEGVANLAGVMQTDVASAAEIMARAVGGSFDRITRWTGPIDDTKTKAEQFEEVLEKLKQRGEGLLGSDANTMTGQWKALSISIGEAAEAVGSYGSWFSALAWKMKQEVDFIAAPFKRAVPVLEGVKNKTSEVTQSVEELAEAHKRHEEYLKSVTKAYDDYLADMDREARLGERIRAAKLKENLSAIDVAEKTGQITPEEAARQRFAHTSGAAQTDFEERQRLLQEKISQETEARSKEQTDEGRFKRNESIRILRAEMEANAVERSSLSIAEENTFRAGQAKLPKQSGDKPSSVLAAIEAGRRTDAEKDAAIANAFNTQTDQWRQQQKAWTARVWQIRNAASHAANLRAQ
jgi:transcriptional regulator with XRE-family HTH domain